MFPIPSERNLPFIKIADYWSREITPRVKPVEVLDGLIKAWWQGELTAANGPSRADMVRALYASYQDRIVFAIPALDEPTFAKELPDGGVEVFRPWRVPLPNARPESWDDTNCAEASEAVAEAWSCDRFELITPSLGWIELAATEFRRWVAANGYQPPTFWASTQDKKGDARSIQRVGENKATKLAQNYIATENKAGRRPTQKGLEELVLGADLHGGREHLRQAFKKLMLKAGVQVKPGRIPKT